MYYIYIMYYVYILLGITGHLKRNWNIVNEGVGREGEVVYPPYNKTVFIGRVYYIVYMYVCI